jgi:threonine aldolase
MRKTISLLKGVIDLRSDTVTKPTAAMRQAMFEAVVGDDVYCEDSTVILLQNRMAEMFGKDKSLFFPTGTMSNLAAVLSWCQRRGSEMILGDKSHIHVYEQGGVSQLGGVATHNLPNKSDGSMCLDAISASIRSSNIHFPVTNLVSIENTHNVCGGRVLPIAYVNDLSRLCRKNNIPLHMDGARIWNASVASGLSVQELVRNVDSVSACMSKGLGAPVGSVLIGPEEMIDRARRIRKALGGGMRQSGVLAAPALQALDDFENSDMIKADHRKAKTLSEALSKLRGVRLNPEGNGVVETNIVIVEITREDINAGTLVEKMKEKNILALAKGSKLIRMVLHRDISDDDVELAIKTITAVCCK